MSESNGPSSSSEDLTANAPNTPPVASPWWSTSRRRIVATTTAVVVAAAVIVITVNAVQGTSGNSTPQAAVMQLLAAAENHDLLGVLGAIAPGERTAIEPGLVGLVNQLERLDVLAKSTDLAHIPGIDLHLSNIATSTRYLNDSLAAVSITRGTVTTETDLSNVPLGSFIAGLLGPAKLGAKTTRTTSAATKNRPFATVQMNGSWYVSIGYTIAFGSLESSHQSITPPPTTGETLSPLGANSATGVVTSFLNATASLNLRAMMADLAPGETSALNTYAPRFISRADASLARVRHSATFRLSGYKLTAQAIGSMTLVKMSGAKLMISSRGISITLHNGCTTVSYLGKTRTSCGTNSSALHSLIAALPPTLRPLANHLQGAKPDVGFMTVYEDGAWFISPTATMLQYLNSVATLIEPGDLTAIAELARHPVIARRDLLRLEQSLGLLATGLLS